MSSAQALDFRVLTPEETQQPALPAAALLPSVSPDGREDAHASQTSTEAATAGTAAPTDSANGLRGNALDTNPDAASALLVNRYYKASEVDEPAYPVELAPLIYPEEPYLRRIAGTVRLRVYINRRGTIDSIDILAAQPPGLFETAALGSVIDSRFHPAVIGGMPVDHVKIIEVVFDPYTDRPQNVDTSPTQ